MKNEKKKSFVSSLKKLNNLVDKNPEAAVNVLRSWLYNNDN